MDTRLDTRLLSLPLFLTQKGAWERGEVASRYNTYGMGSLPTTCARGAGNSGDSAVHARILCAESS